MGFDDINETLDKAEERWTNLILASSWTAVDRLLERLTQPFNKLDTEAIESELKKFTIAGTIQALLFNAWAEIFEVGSKDGIIEVNEVSKVDRQGAHLAVGGG